MLKQPVSFLSSGFKGLMELSMSDLFDSSSSTTFPFSWIDINPSPISLFILSGYLLEASERYNFYSLSGDLDDLAPGVIL